MEHGSACSNEDLVCIASELLTRWEQLEQTVPGADAEVPLAEDWEFE